MEIFDAGLLGEFVIPSLRHAWKEMLVDAPLSGGGAHVIPRRAIVYVSAVECCEIWRKSQYYWVVRLVSRLVHFFIKGC